MSASAVVAAVQDMVAALKVKCPRLSPAIFPTSQSTPRSLEDLCATAEQVEQVKRWMESRSSSGSGGGGGGGSSSSSSSSSSKQKRTGSSSSSVGGGHGRAYAFVTEVDYAQRTVRITKVLSMANEVDATLSSLETMMRLLLMGNEAELNVLLTRFLEANGYRGDVAEEQHVFLESYNLAYAVKVLLGNTPGMQVTLGGHTVPFNDDVNVAKVLSSILREGTDDIDAGGSAGRGGGGGGDDGDDEDDDDDDDDKDDDGGTKGRARTNGAGSEKRRKRKRGKKA